MSVFKLNSRIDGQRSMELEFQMFKSMSSMSGNTIMSLAFGGGFDGISGKKAQQWYAYANTSVWIRGKSSGDGNSLKLGLLNVFKCNKRSRPADGKCGNMLFPKFLKVIGNNQISSNVYDFYLQVFYMRNWQECIWMYERYLIIL